MGTLKCRIGAKDLRGAEESMINAYFSSYFSKAWLTPERIEMVTRAMGSTWGPEKFGPQTPSRQFTPTAFAKAIAKMDVEFEMGKSSWTERRAAGDVNRGGSPDMESLGCFKVFVQNATRAERDELRDLFEWAAALPECALASYTENKGPLEMDWRAVSYRSKNHHFQRKGLPFPAFDTFYGASLISHLPEGCLPEGCRPFAHGQRLVLVERGQSPDELDVETVRALMEQAAKPLQAAGVCGHPSDDGLHWGRAKNWVPLTFDPNLDPESPTPPLELSSRHLSTVEPDVERAAMEILRLKAEWDEALLRDMDDDGLENLALSIVDSLDRVRDLDPANAHTLRHQVELLIGPGKDRPRALQILEEMRDQSMDPEFVTLVVRGGCTAPFL